MTPSTPPGEEPPTSIGARRSVAALGWAWVLALVAVAAGLVTLRALDEPIPEQQSLAAALGVVLAVGLSWRTDGRVFLALALAVTVGGAAVVTQWPLLLAGAAVATAILAACLAVLATRPAPTFRTVVREVVLALLIASAGGLGAAGFAVGVDHERFAYTVLGLSLVATTALVYRLGGGLHGLGRRGLMLAAGSLVLLVIVLVYTAALTTYGSPELILEVRNVQDWTREHLGGVPHPVEVLVGIPALAWGVSLRSRRRQGWWACVFGTAATGHVASDLVDRAAIGPGTALSAAYSIVLGLLLGYVLIRLEQALTGRVGRAGGGPTLAAREEPGRLHRLH
jgi:hypothetical protein